jgi:uncharacterized protein (DUF885 family)
VAGAARRCRPVLVVAGLALALRVLPAGAQPELPLGNDRLDALAGRYFAEEWRLEPIQATRAGVHDYDGQLGSFDAAGFTRRVDSARSYLDELNAIDPDTMGAEASYDAQILRSRLQATILDLGEIQSWRHDPAYYTSQASSAIDALISRDFAPLPDRVASVIAREREIPEMLAAARANVTSTDAATADRSDRDIAGAIAFFRDVVPPAVASVRDRALLDQFAAANAAALAALGVYRAALGAGPFAHPSGTFAIGAAHFADLLRLQELTSIPLGRYERAGVEALTSTKAEFVAAAKAIDPTASPEAVAESLGPHHPAAGDLFGTAASDLGALRRFVSGRDLLTLPSDDDVEVVATPLSARSTTDASLDAPGPLETKATKAYYYVTPVEPDWTPARKEQHLSFFNDYAFPLVSAHEVMPGHYVNFALDRHEKLSLIRRLLPSASFSEGWAHYDEQMLVDEGWGNGDPRVRLAQLALALERECRYLVGLREHTENMSVDQATKFFEDNAFMAEEPAHREALRGTQDPLYGYDTLGKLEILKLRDDYRRTLGSRYSLKLFHDQLLAHGDPPVAIVRKIMLGADDDGNVL